MPEISQEELDKLRALQAREETRLNSPLGAPEGEGLAARSIADYLRGAGPLSSGGGGGLSYGNTASNVPDFRALAAARGQARDAGASIAELQAVDAQQRQQNEQNPFGYNDRQTQALDLAWQSSPDRVALEATNKERAAQGLPALNSTYGMNYYHTNEDGSRDYNYSKEGTYRGEVPSQFATGDPNNPYAAHFNNDTGQWEAGDLSLMATLKDIGSGFKDAYGNIRETIPQMGAEVVSGFKDLYGNLTGKKEAEAEAQAAEIAKQQAAQQASSQAAAIQAAQAQTAAHQAQAAQVAAQDNRDRQSSGSQSLAAATRAQLGKTNAFSAANKATTAGAASNYGGFNMGGYVGYNDGGMVGHRMAGGEFMSGIEHKGTGGAVTGMSPDTFINGEIKSVHYPTPAGARNQPAHLNMGGPISYMQAGGGIAKSLIDDDEEERQRQRQMQMQQAPLSGGGGIGSQIKNQAIGQAASMATKALFSGLTGGTGGVLAGLFGGNNGGHVQTMQSPLGRSYNNGGPVEGAADVLVKELSSRRPAGLQLPTQRFGHGGGVTATMIPGGGPVKKVKTQNKSSKGHGSKDEMMEIEFDTAVPPMSEMALTALGQK